ncbi:MAG: hypothetical protein ACRDYA_20730 [Egibacteraceae bacterium]
MGCALPRQGHRPGGVVVAAYAYVNWRLNRLGAPTVEEWRKRERPSEPQPTVS